MIVTLSIVGFVLFIFGLAAVASWSQKRNPPRSDAHREVGRSTQHDSGWGDVGGPF